MKIIISWTTNGFTFPLNNSLASVSRVTGKVADSRGCGPVNAFIITTSFDQFSFTCLSIHQSIYKVLLCSL